MPETELDLVAAELGPGGELAPEADQEGYRRRMARRKEVQQQRVGERNLEKGLVLVFTGDGKGKSTAAFGLALRAHGRGKAVKIFQFMKVPSARFGEHRMFEQIGIPIEGLGDGFSWKSQDLEHSAQLARNGWEKAKATILGGDHFLVVLDEVTYPLIYGWLPLEDVLATLRAAAPKQRLRQSHSTGRVAIRAEDFHIQRYQQRASSCLILALDASGSA